MRAQGTACVPAVLALLLLTSLALVVTGDGGIDPRLPEGLYAGGDGRPVVDFPNATFEEGGSHLLELTVSFPGVERDVTVEVELELYSWGMYSEERPYSDKEGPKPSFAYPDDPLGDRDVLSWSNTTTVAEGGSSTLSPEVDVPDGCAAGYYRVRVLLEMDDGTTARSMGHFSTQEWRDNLDRVRAGEPPLNADFLVSEAGLTVVPPGFRYVSQPNRVPDFGHFTTPVIRPGDRGTYNFTVTNRYEGAIEDVTVTIEVYMWATIEESKPIEDLRGKVPGIEDETSDGTEIHIVSPDIPSGDSRDFRITISTQDDTVKGTYFVRHSIRFTYENETFIMGSRGYFTRDQWEGFDYTNLYYQLGVAGIVPDSSFSVKDPVPLWPLATLIGLCVLLGVLAVVFYLAEEHGERYPRLKRGLQYWSGRWEQRKRLMQRRLEDIRAKQEEDREGPPPDDG